MPRICAEEPRRWSAHSNMVAGQTFQEYEFCQPFESVVETCTSFCVRSGLNKLADSQHWTLTYPIPPTIIHFPLSDAPAPVPAASTHCWLVMNSAVWSELPSVTSAEPILKCCKIVNFIIIYCQRCLNNWPFGARNSIMSNLFCFIKFVSWTETIPTSSAHFLLPCSLLSANNHPPPPTWDFCLFVPLMLPGLSPPHVLIKPYYIPHFCRPWGIKPRWSESSVRPNTHYNPQFNIRGGTQIRI